MVRDRIGDQEDRLFSTIFFGSGLLFIAMSFVAAIGGGLVASLAADAERTIDSGIAAFGRAITYNVTHVYAIRMATVWLRTGSLPRLAALVTYILALLHSSSIRLWTVLAVPAWVRVISLEHLIRNLPHKDSAVTPPPA